MLSRAETDKILQLVKREPCTIQDISFLLGKSWVTAESYVEKIARETGLIKTKKFRSGTKGAVKIVYWNYAETISSDEIRAKLFEKIKLLANKNDFDPLEVFQFVSPNQGKAFIESLATPPPASFHSLIQFLNSVEEELLIFSGNFSFLSYSVIQDSFRQMLQRGVRVKAVSRVDFATLENIKRLRPLFQQFPQQIEVRHSRQPLRGFIADSKKVRLKDEKLKSEFKDSELAQDVRLFFEIYDPEWIAWFQNVFWYLFRTAPDYQHRLAHLENVSL